MLRPTARRTDPGGEGVVESEDEEQGNSRSRRKDDREPSTSSSSGVVLLLFLLLFGPIPRRHYQTISIVLLSVLIVLLIVPILLYWNLSSVSLHRESVRTFHLPAHAPREWSWWYHNYDNMKNASTVQPAPWMIFYNVYIPNETDAQHHALQIVAEQLDQVKQSFAAEQKNLHIYYNTIGTDHVLLESWMQQQVNTPISVGIRVHHGQHFAAANEDVTLQDLYDFCHSSSRYLSQEEASNVKVIYLHSKGSFHYETPTFSSSDLSEKKKFATQDQWRRILTQAATHRYCLEPPTSATAENKKEEAKEIVACDTCSLLMQPLPSIHYPGNMWSASCSYIQKLVPPLGFDRVMDRQVVRSFTQLRDQFGTLQAGFFPQMPHMMGRKRFAPEHWLGSAPRLLHPCHVTTTANLSQWLYPSDGESDPPHMIPAYRAPGFALTHEHWDFYRYGKRGSTVLNNETLRKQDYFLLPGQLLKWYQLYRAVPPPESWVWKWFPDALYWQEQIAAHARTDRAGRLVVGYSLLALWEKRTDAA